MLATSRTADRVIGPSFNAFKQIALFAWIPLIAVWFGMGEPAKVVFISLAVFPPVLLNTYEGIRSVGKEYVEVAKAFEFSRWQLYRRVILPAATPQIFTGLRLGLIYAWLATIGAEYFLKAGPGIVALAITRFGFDHVQAAALVSAQGLAFIIALFVLGGVARRLGEEGSYLVASLVVVAALGSLGLAQRGVHLWLGALLLGLGLGLLGTVNFARFAQLGGGERA